MSDHLLYIAEQFKGKFISTPEVIGEKLSKIKAYVFDWDGVFNNGQKDDNGSSPFSEVDAMGTNMLRFNHWLRTGTLPVVSVISGERNKASFTLSKREHFHAVYCGVKHKTEALDDLCARFELKPEEVAFVFDDVLDLSLAARAGLRVIVSRDCNPLLIDLVIKNQWVEYVTANSGGEHAVRETVELLSGIGGKYEETILDRMQYSERYRQYLAERNAQEPEFYTIKDSKAVKEDIS